MATERGFRVDGTARVDLASAYALTQGTIGGHAVSEWYPADLSSAPAAPTLEERADRWLDQHRDAMTRLAEL